MASSERFVASNARSEDGSSLRSCDILMVVDLLRRAPGSFERRVWGLLFEGITHLALVVPSTPLVGVSRPGRCSLLTKASSATTGMILRRPTFRLGSSWRNTSVATVRADNPSRRAASTIPTASTVSSRCILVPPNYCPCAANGQST